MAVTESKAPWYTSRRVLLTTLAIFGIVLIVEFYLAIFVRSNDFYVHRAYGQIFLRGDPASALQFHYFLGRGMINAMTAWLPNLLDRSFHFFSALVALVVTLKWWHELANEDHPVATPLARVAAIATILLTSGYLIRDLDDCGLQLWLVFFLTAALRAFKSSRFGIAGFWLGLSAVYKTTPVLFLPLLLWKRQWRPAAWMAVWFVTLNLVPALYIGWDRTWECHRQWFRFATNSLGSTDPSYNGLEHPRPVNQGLPLALARYLQTYPQGHPLALEHPWYIQTGNLAPLDAKRASTGILLILAAVLAWRFRRTVPTAHEWAAVILLCALLSPLCWLQHLVVIVPCVFLWGRAYLGGVQVPRWQLPVMGLFVAIVLLVHREFMTASFYGLLVAYKVHTLAGLLTLGLVLTLPERRAIAEVRELPLARAA